MDKNAVHATAVSYYSEEDEGFIVESNLLSGFIGAADTEEEAWELFEHFVDEAYVAYLEGKLGGRYSSPGRPPKGQIPFAVRVDPQTKIDVSEKAAEIGCSQGEFIDYLWAFWKANWKPREVAKPAAKRRATTATPKVAEPTRRYKAKVAAGKTTRAASTGKKRA